MKTLAIALSVAAAGFFAPASSQSDPSPIARHFALERSEPAAGAQVEAPAEVRLWFTEKPQDGTVSIRLPGSEDAGVHVMEAVQDPEDATVFSIQIHGTLPPATYAVAWRGMGQDGHVVRETFEFTVAAR